MTSHRIRYHFRHPHHLFQKFALCCLKPVNQKQIVEYESEVTCGRCLEKTAKWGLPVKKSMVFSNVLKGGNLHG